MSLATDRREKGGGGEGQVKELPGEKNEYSESLTNNRVFIWENKPPNWAARETPHSRNYKIWMRGKPYRQKGKCSERKEKGWKN